MGAGGVIVTKVTVTPPASRSSAADETIAAAFYGGVLMVLGVLVNAMWRYAAQGHRLLSDHVSPDEARRIGRRYLVGPLGYAVATLSALVVPWVAVAIFFLLNVFFLWPRREHGGSWSPTGE